MKFIVDANLPPAFTRWLTSEGHGVYHVSDLGRARMSDRARWQHARGIDCIVTKDQDFMLLHTLDRSGPAIVWIRIGNAVRGVSLAGVWPAVLSAIERGDNVIEVR